MNERALYLLLFLCAGALYLGAPYTIDVVQYNVIERDSVVTTLVEVDSVVTHLVEEKRLRVTAIDSIAISDRFGEVDMLKMYLGNRAVLIPVVFLSGAPVEGCVSGTYYNFKRDGVVCESAN